MLPNSFEVEAATRLRSYERRIARLETLEDAGGGGGDFILIEHKTLTGGEASIIFSDIPVAHTHLFIIYSVSSNVAGPEDTLGVQMNGDAGANYSWIQRRMIDDDTQFTTSTVVGTFVAVAAESNSGVGHAPGWILIPDYLGENNEKALRAGGFSEFSNSTMLLGIMGGMWRTYTEAIDSLTFLISGGTFLAGSVISLYGIN